MKGISRTRFIFCIRAFMLVFTVLLLLLVYLVAQG